MDDSTPHSDPISTWVKDRDFRMLIHGELVESADGGTTTTVDPSTGKDLVDVPEASAEDVRRAIDSSEKAQPKWEALGVKGRTRHFEKFASLVAEHREELAMLDAIDCGNPVDRMRFDIDLALEYVEGWPHLAAAMKGEVIPASPGNLHYTASRPYGVVGRITAFNHPVMFGITRPLPSLITGNTVVMKPAPQTPLSALRLASLFQESFPPGVINVVPGGAAVGDALVTDPRVKRLAFTGSIATGLTIQRRAAESGTVKNITLELGGKNAMIVMPDADLDAAVDGAIFGMNFNVCQGQSCGSNSRVLLHPSIYDDFTKQLVEKLSSVKVGSAYDESVDMGPLVSSAHFARVMGLVESGVKEGASLLTGGIAPEGVPAGGYYLSPTVFGDVESRMTIAHEEIFGPVISVMKYESFDEMIALANGLDLGLTASIWTRDIDLAHRTADLLDAGYIWINDSSRHYFGTPFGGTKNSGIGREESADELLSYLETKVVHTRLGDPRAAFDQVVASRRKREVGRSGMRVK